MPSFRRDHLREEARLNDSSEEQTAKRSASQVVADQVSLLQMVKENIRGMRSQTPSPEPVLVLKPKPEQKGPRSTSSSYPEDAVQSEGLPSPKDSHFALSKLGDLGKYSRTNDRLSGLRSSSSSSGATRALSQGSIHKALTDAAPVTGKLQRLPTPSYHRFEILSSSEDLTSNALAPHNSEVSHESESSAEDSDDSLEKQPLKRVTAHTGFDNLADRFHSESPSPSVKLPQIIKSRKRKASSISLQGISAGVKRSRIEINKLATNIYHNGWDKLRQARGNIKRQRKEQKKQRSVWKSLRRRFRPVDAIKDKHEKGFVALSAEKGLRASKSWWKAGVEKYQAPEWMHFGR